MCDYCAYIDAEEYRRTFTRSEYNSYLFLRDTPILTWKMPYIISATFFGKDPDGWMYRSEIENNPQFEQFVASINRVKERKKLADSTGKEFDEFIRFPRGLPAKKQARTNFNNAVKLPFFQKRPVSGIDARGRPTRKLQWRLIPSKECYYSLDYHFAKIDGFGFGVYHEYVRKLFDWQSVETDFKRRQLEETNYKIHELQATKDVLESDIANSHLTYAQKLARIGKPRTSQ